MCAVCKRTCSEYYVPVIVYSNSQFILRITILLFLFFVCFVLMHCHPRFRVCHRLRFLLLAFHVRFFVDLKKRQSKSHILNDGLHVIFKGKPANNVWHTHTRTHYFYYFILIYKHSRNSNKISLQIIVRLLLMHCCNRHQFVCAENQSSRVASRQVHFVYSAVFTRRIFVAVLFRSWFL